jgi:hypothetical protein
VSPARLGEVQRETAKNTSSVIFIYVNTPLEAWFDKLDPRLETSSGSAPFKLRNQPFRLTT